MSYSRRELYAMGEPLGESVTRLKPGGGRIYGGGGGMEDDPWRMRAGDGFEDLTQWL